MKRILIYLIVVAALLTGACNSSEKGQEELVGFDVEESIAVTSGTCVIIDKPIVLDKYGNVLSVYVEVSDAEEKKVEVEFNRFFALDTGGYTIFYSTKDVDGNTYSAKTSVQVIDLPAVKDKAGVAVKVSSENNFDLKTLLDNDDIALIDRFSADVEIYYEISRIGEAPSVLEDGIIENTSRFINSGYTWSVCARFVNESRKLIRGTIAFYGDDGFIWNDTNADPDKYGFGWFGGTDIKCGNIEKAEDPKDRQGTYFKVNYEKPYYSFNLLPLYAREFYAVIGDSELLFDYWIPENGVYVSTLYGENLAKAGWNTARIKISDLLAIWDNLDGTGWTNDMIHRSMFFIRMENGNFYIGNFRIELQNGNA